MVSLLIIRMIVGCASLVMQRRELGRSIFLESAFALTHFNRKDHISELYFSKFSLLAGRDKVMIFVSSRQQRTIR